MCHTFVIFGASGDLTSRKLIPALYKLHAKKRLPDDTKIVGVSRTDLSHDAWRELLREAAQEFLPGDFDAGVWNTFEQSVFYSQGDIRNPGDYSKLSQFLDELERGRTSTRVYYLSTSPKLYEDAVKQLGDHKLAMERDGNRRHVVVEKPFGTDLESAQKLNRMLHQVFQEHQVYRIDHYLGKETVQNMLVLRFANSIFEPLWNRNYVDHVQITVAESVDVGDRAGYYDTSGVLRDMFQNHLLQLLMITAMEAPVRMEADAIRNEKVKVLQAIRKYKGADFASNTIRGQYAGYLNEKGVPNNSTTATFAALKLYVDNWRWNGVPFYLRSGKAMSCRTTQIVIDFRQPPHMLFVKQKEVNANRLVIQIQPAEGIQLYFRSKVPDAEILHRSSELDFRFSNHNDKIPDAYQRLLLDALNGDASLFARSDEVELAWGIIDPIIAAWQGPAASSLETYQVGEWGPQSCNDWMDSHHHREWFDICPVL